MLRFRLRTLLIAVTVVAMAMPWAVRKFREWQWSQLSGEGAIYTAGWTTTGCYLSFDEDHDNCGPSPDGPLPDPAD
jgi:hypothetical protein